MLSIHACTPLTSPGAADLEPVVHAQDAVDLGELLRLFLLPLRIDGPFKDGDAVIDVDLDLIVLEVRRPLELQVARVRDFPTGSPRLELPENYPVTATCAPRSSAFTPPSDRT
jgi:hypothetical protein